MSSRIRTISAINLKAISELSIDFNGCTAIITAGNNEGKTTFLTTLVNRIKGIKPEYIVKKGEEKGEQSITLTTGETFKWVFDINGKDRLQYISADGTIKTAVTKAIANKYFPELFDVDEFMKATPSLRVKMFQKLVGIDFTDINAEYTLAYSNRTNLNRDADKARVKLQATAKPEQVEPVDTDSLIKEKEVLRDSLNKKYQENKAENARIRGLWEEECNQTKARVEEFNLLQKKNFATHQEVLIIVHRLQELGWVDNKLTNWVDTLKAAIKPNEEYVALPEPEWIVEMPDDSELKALDQKLADASKINMQAKSYQDYLVLEKEYTDAQALAAEADKKVKAIEQRKQEMLTGAKLPRGIEMTDDGITVDGFPFDENQISTSKFYITALKLATIGLGEVRSLHFDASPLDKESLTEIMKWAEIANLQLFIERPEYNGGEITYELIEDNNGGVATTKQAGD